MSSLEKWLLLLKTSFYGVPLWVILGLSVFLVLFLIPAGVKKKRLRRVEFLKNCKTVSARVVRIYEVRRSVRTPEGPRSEVNFVIELTYTDPGTGKVWKFESEPITSVPFNLPWELKVYWSVKDPSKYIVEVPGRSLIRVS